MRSQIRHPLLLELYDYWESLRRGDALPPRAEFDPLAIPRLMPYLIVNEVERGAKDVLRFRIRLEGQAVIDARGQSAKGRYLDEPGVVVLHDDVLRAYAKVVAGRRPWYSEGTFAPDRFRSGTLYRLALPFTGAGTDAERVDFIVVGFIHEVEPAGR